MAAHLVAQDAELAELAAGGELNEEAVRLAGSTALGIDGLAPLLDAPWPAAWLRAAGVEVAGDCDAVPTAGEAVAVIDAVLDGRLAGTLDVPPRGFLEDLY